MTATLKKIEKISKALGDVNRLKILQHIAKQGGSGLCAGLQDCVSLAQPSISHHIKILIEAGILDAEKDGRNYTYTLNKVTMTEYMDAIGAEINVLEE